MTRTYRLDIRYIPETGVNALRRVQRLTETVSNEGFEVFDVSVLDDGMRVSMFATTDAEGRSELKLLNLVSATGSIGRFSCREASEIESDDRAAAEIALA